MIKKVINGPFSLADPLTLTFGGLIQNSVGIILDCGKEHV